MLGYWCCIVCPECRHLGKSNISGHITSVRRNLHRVDTAGRIAGLNLNAKKTKVMHVRGKTSLDEIMYTDITVDGTVLEKS